MAQGKVVLRQCYGNPRTIGFRDMRTGSLYAGSMVAERDGSDMIEEPTVRADLVVMGITPGAFGFTTTADRERCLQVDTGTYGPFTNSAGSDAITAADIDKIVWTVDGTTVARLGVLEADLVTFANEIRTDYIAHAANATAHNAADTINTVAHSASTNLATVLTLLAEMRDNYEKHRVHVAELTVDVHDARDNTNFLALPAPRTAAQALAFMLDFKTKYNLHIATAAPVHNSADVTNPISSTATGRSPAGYARYVLDNGGVVVDFSFYESIAQMRIGGAL